MKVAELNSIDDRNLVCLFVANPLIVKIEDLISQEYTVSEILKHDFQNELNLSINGYFA